MRNLGPHGFDMFLHLTGEEAQVTAAQLSHRAHECAVEDYASVMLRSASGVLGTVEVGNGFPRDGTDGEWKLAGRDGILTMKDGILKFATAAGDEIFPGTDLTAPYFTAVRDALDHWQRGAPPPISVHDCARMVRLIDQAYARRRSPCGVVLVIIRSTGDLVWLETTRRIPSAEMRYDLLAHQLQRAHHFVGGNSTAAIDLGEHAAETERAGHLRKPLHYGVRRPDDHLVAQHVRVRDRLQRLSSLRSPFACAHARKRGRTLELQPQRSIELKD